MLTSVLLVRSEHLNHQNHLFGGDLMAEIDTIGFCLVSREFPACEFVTRAAEIGFEAPARLGDIITFAASVLATGETSVRIEVTGTVGTRRICRAVMVYVSVGPDGGKRAVRKS